MDCTDMSSDNCMIQTCNLMEPAKRIIVLNINSSHLELSYCHERKNSNIRLRVFSIDSYSGSVYVR